MAKKLEIVLEAAKKPNNKPKAEKPVDPNEESRKLRGLQHKVGHMVHAGLAVKGGAGFRGEVVKIDDDHTYIKIGKDKYGDKIVKAPHRLVSVQEETKEQKKDRLRREAKIEARSARDYEELENKIEGRDERSKRRHERARRLHQEETTLAKKLSKHHKLVQIKNKIIDEGK